MPHPDGLTCVDGLVFAVSGTLTQSRSSGWGFRPNFLINSYGTVLLTRVIAWKPSCAGFVGDTPLILAV